MLAAPDQDHYGLDLMRVTGRQSGTIYPLLARLEERGLVTSSWEMSDEPGPRRRLYRLTEAGTQKARELKESR
jgi:PadR family transcriptional regulator, regulatory protein PadR